MGQAPQQCFLCPTVQDDNPSPNDAVFLCHLPPRLPHAIDINTDDGTKLPTPWPAAKRAGYYDYDDYYNNMQGYEAYMQKRGGYCIGFGRSCSTKGITCCGENICKCNLFRTNCRCQRSGLFGRR